MATELPDGWLTEAEAEELARLASGKIVLELGAWKGRSTIALARVARNVVSVDLHRGLPETGGEDTLAAYFDNVRQLKNVSSLVAEFDMARLFRADAFDLVFVDGFHDFDSVRLDLQLARRFEAVIALHDWGRFEVTPAAEALAMTPDRVVGSLAVFE